MFWTELKHALDIALPVGVGVAFLALLLYYIVVDTFDKIKRKWGKRK